ncbi:hypothetical protein [Moraxella lacunata]
MWGGGLKSPKSLNLRRLNGAKPRQRAWFCFRVHHTHLPPIGVF